MFIRRFIRCKNARKATNEIERMRVRVRVRVWDRKNTKITYNNNFTGWIMQRKYTFLKEQYTQIWFKWNMRFLPPKKLTFSWLFPYKLSPKIIYIYIYMHIYTRNKDLCLLRESERECERDREFDRLMGDKMKRDYLRGKEKERER